MKILLYVYIEVKAFGLFEMRRDALMNYMLAVLCWLFKDSTKVSLVYSSSEGWGFYYYMVIRIDETRKVKYSLAARSVYCE